MLVLGISVLARLVASAGGGTRAISVAPEGRATETIQSGSTLLAVTSDRPKLLATVKRGDGPRLLSIDLAPVATEWQSFLSPWLHGPFGASPAIAPLPLALSPRAPPS